MKSIRRIIILVHEYHQSGFSSSPYLLRHIADLWRSSGLEVSVIHAGDYDVDADLAILHVDLTVVPVEYLEFIRKYPVVINGRVTDISKSRISRNLVRRDDNYKGPVIVKTNQNYGGKMEYKLAAKGSLLQGYMHKVRNMLPWSCRSKLSPSQYRIFESVDQVPRMVWRNPSFIIERFLPERRDGNYCVRTWLFMGDRERSALFYSRDPIIKSDNIIGREPLTDVPEDLRLLRREMGFDYGKFDYAVVDGRVVLYDANRTPSLGAFSREHMSQLLEQLAGGIHSYV